MLVEAIRHPQDIQHQLDGKAFLMKEVKLSVQLRDALRQINPRMGGPRGNYTQETEREELLLRVARLKEIENYTREAEKLLKAHRI